MVGRRTTEAGISLIEVVCALAVLSALGLGLVHGGQNHARSIASAFAETRALRLAQGELERIRVADRTEVRPGRSAIEFTAEQRTGWSELSGEVSIEPAGPAADGLLSITATVRWRPSGARTTRSVSLVTLRALELRR